jgi:hypothetical protein
MAKLQLSWSDLDIAPAVAADKKLSAAVDKHTEAAAKAREALKVVEGHLAEVVRAKGVVPAGHEPVFGYRFGRWSVAFKPVTDKPGKITL